MYNLSMAQKAANGVGACAGLEAAQNNGIGETSPRGEKMPSIRNMTAEEAELAQAEDAKIVFQFKAWPDCKP